MEIDDILSLHFTPIAMEYCFQHQPIISVNETKDLGVIFDAISSSALRSLGFIIRNSKSFNIYTAKTLYCSIVRSVLEYLSPTWSLHYNTYKDILESLQNNFLRYINYKLGYSNLLNLSTLEARRDINGLLQLFKILNNFISSTDLVNRINSHVPSVHTRSHQLFQINFAGNNYLYHSPLIRLHRCGNLLEQQNIDILTLKWTISESCSFYKNNLNFDFYIKTMDIFIIIFMFFIYNFYIFSFFFF